MFRLPVDSSLDLILLETRHAGMPVLAGPEENRAHLRRYLPWVDATPLPRGLRGVDPDDARGLRAAQSLNVGLLEPRGPLVGVAGCHAFDWANRRTSVGYWLGEARHSGQGAL